MHLAYVIAPGGGPEAFAKTICPWLQNHGHTVSVVYTCRPGEVNATFPSSVRVACAPTGQLHYYISKAVRGFRALPLRVRAWEQAQAVKTALDRLDSESRIDLVEVTEGLSLSPLNRYSTVVRAHGSDWTFRYYCQDGDTSRDRWLIDQESRQLAQAAGASAISKHLATHLTQFCKVAPGKIRVVPYPIDTLAFSPATTKEPPNGPVLLTVGRLEKRKGVDVLLQALSLGFWQQFPDLTVYLLGNEAGLSRNALLQMVPPEFRRHVVFPGFVDHAKLVDYYRAATVYLAPTLYETFGYTILEAMACGLPVIASRAGAIPELVQDRVNGLLVPAGDAPALADAITSLLRDAGWRAQMARNSQEKAAGFCLDSVMKRLVEFYEQSLATP